jgi:hypothetical protein
VNARSETWAGTLPQREQPLDESEHYRLTQWIKANGLDKLLDRQGLDLIYMDEEYILLGLPHNKLRHN